MTQQYTQHNSSHHLRVPYLEAGFVPYTLSLIITQSYQAGIIFFVSKAGMLRFTEVRELLSQDSRSGLYISVPWGKTMLHGKHSAMHFYDNCLKSQ